MASLSQIFEMHKQAEFENKVAALETAWKNDEVRIDLLNEALDIIKVAQEQGELPEMDGSQIIDLGVAMVEDSLTDAPAEVQETEVTKEASAEELEQLNALGEEVGSLLSEYGLEVDDLEKIASEEEAEELGRLCAQELAKRYAEAQ